MAARLTDKQKKKIIAERVQGRSLRDIASEYGVAASTIKRICERDIETERLATQKKEENTADILAYMESKKNIVCEILGKGLDALNGPDKLAEATPAQITTALGTLIDKWTAIGGGPGGAAKEDGLSQSLREMAEGLESDGK